MIDVAVEETDTLTRAARWVPRGGNDAAGKPRKVSASTMWRWAEYGVEGIKLETIYVGAVRYTSRQALQRFFEAVTAARAGGSPASDTSGRQPTKRTRTESQRRKAAAEAGVTLDRMIANPPRRGRKAATASR